MTALYDPLVFISSVYYFIIHLDNTKESIKVLFHMWDKYFKSALCSFFGKNNIDGIKMLNVQINPQMKTP